MKKILGTLMIMTLLLNLFAGCANNEEATTQDEVAKSVDSKTEDTDEEVVLNYWTWFPSEEQLAETIENFENENPGIKINMTVMVSTTYQDKVPLALSTGEDIDVIGVQPSKFAASVEDYLIDLEDYMPTVLGDNWKEGYSDKMFEKGKTLTSDQAKFITILNSGSMFGYYNATLLDELGKEVPTTIAEYKEVADALKAKYPEKLAGVFAGKDSWVVDEMLLTVLGQQGDYYNQFVYEDAKLDSPEYKEAMNGLKQYFDEGIFSMDIMDLDYGSASEAFVNGEALVYYMGSWDAPLISSKLREINGVSLNEVGIMALPVVEDDGVPAVRSYLDCGLGIVETSTKKEAAAKFVQYLSTGNGVGSVSKQFAGTPGISDFEMDSSYLTSDVARESWNTLLDLMNNATADRNNMSAFASAVEGSVMQSVINGSMTVEEALETMQEEWDSGDY